MPYFEKVVVRVGGVGSSTIIVDEHGEEHKRYKTFRAGIPAVVAQFLKLSWGDFLEVKVHDITFIARARKQGRAYNSFIFTIPAKVAKKIGIRKNQTLEVELRKR